MVGDRFELELVMKRLAIIGLGLMGGSLGLAVKRRKLAACVCGYARRAETRKLALKLKAVDEIFETPEAAVQNADMVVFCVPILAIPALAKACRKHFAPNCIVTDVGSTKAKLISDLKPVFANIPATFVGSHPIAGSDETGIEAARTDLYEGALAIVTGNGQKQAAMRKVVRFWQNIGMTVSLMNPREHDRIIARTSHLPHLVASILVSSVCKGRCDEVMRFCGTGFRDATRIAGGSEDLWHDIVKTNSAFVSGQLGEFRKVLDRVKRMIDSGDFEGLRRFLAESRERRREFDTASGKRRTK
jgi:cyclohexadieny/prephenate dehydrogenase